MVKVEFVIGNSFDEIFEKLSFKYKEYSKEILSSLIFESEKVSPSLEKTQEQLKPIFEEALNICFGTLYPKDISLYIFPTSNEFIVKYMGGISGFAPYKDNIFIFINQKAFENIEKIKEVVLHEFNHTCFYEKNKWDVLLDSFIAEGLADVYTTEILKIKIPVWSGKFSLKEIKNYWNKLENNLQKDDLHSKVFFGVNGEFPNWLGYSIGFQIVSFFRQKYPNLSWKEIMKHNPSEIFKLSGFEEVIKN